MAKVGDTATMEAALQRACGSNLGVIDQGFLCQSVGALGLATPVTVDEATGLDAVVSLLRTKRIGCVIVVNDRGCVSGIFSERDLLLKVLPDFEKNRQAPISQFMTPDPIREQPDTTVAYILSLMSQGGFRHVPIVDSGDKPIGMVSVKDVVDHIVGKFMESLMAVPTGPA